MCFRKSKNHQSGENAWIMWAKVNPSFKTNLQTGKLESTSVASLHAEFCSGGIPNPRKEGKIPLSGHITIASHVRRDRKSWHKIHQCSRDY
jgi:hypothetical protein